MLWKGKQICSLVVFEKYQKLCEARNEIYYNNYYYYFCIQSVNGWLQDALAKRNSVATRSTNYTRFLKHVSKANVIVDSGWMGQLYSSIQGSPKVSFDVESYPPCRIIRWSSRLVKVAASRASG